MDDMNPRNKIQYKYEEIGDLLDTKIRYLTNEPWNMTATFGELYVSIKFTRFKSKPRANLVFHSYSFQKLYTGGSKPYWLRNSL